MLVILLLALWCSTLYCKSHQFGTEYGMRVCQIKVYMLVYDPAVLAYTLILEYKNHSYLTIGVNHVKLWIFCPGDPNTPDNPNTYCELEW